MLYSSNHWLPDAHSISPPSSPCIRIWVSGFQVFKVSGFHFRVSGFHFRVSGLHFRVSGFHFRVSGFHFRASGFQGSRVFGRPLDLSAVLPLQSGLRFRGFHSFRISGFQVFRFQDFRVSSSQVFRVSGSQGFRFLSRVPDSRGSRGSRIQVSCFVFQGFRVSGVGFGSRVQ